MEIIIGKSYLTRIPHEGKEISFEHPAYLGCYEEVAEKIDKAGLKRPSSAETASLVYDAWKNSPKEEGKCQILEILRNDFLWEFTGNLYLPKSNGEINNGVLIEYNPKIVNRKLIMDKNSLIKRLQENDSLVKFIPFGYRVGAQTPKELEKNKYILARYGEEGAEKIAEIALKYGGDPNLFSFNYVNIQKTRMSALDSGFGGGMLGVYGDDRNSEEGYAFGLCKDKGASN